MSELRLPNFTAAARSFLKTVALLSPWGPRLQARHRRRRYIRELSGWTAADDAALRFYAQFIGPNDTCFDVGANRGTRTKIFRRLAARVVAVEPQRSCNVILGSAYAGDPKVCVVTAACGAVPGKGVIRISEQDGLSSLSDEWISAVKHSGRFAASRWTREEPCDLVTLDDLIQTYGKPSFIKIDVEGYELHVLKGLTRAVPCLSFEFTPERLETAVECIDHLCSLGLSQFNVSWGESFTLLLDSWIGRDEFAVLLKRYRDDHLIYGDVYARGPVKASVAAR